LPAPVEQSTAEARQTAPADGDSPAAGDLLRRARKIAFSTPLLGAAVAVFTWPIGNVGATVGLDPSWVAGLYMALERGMDAGSEITFAYGPLGFLGLPNVYEVWPGRLAFAWTMLVHGSLCVGLLWASRRAFGLPVALVLAALAAAAPTADPILLVATVVAAAAILDEWSPRARLGLAIGFGALGGMQLLGALRAGPTLLLMGAAALLALPERRRTYAAFAGSALLSFATFWFATGQGVSNLDDYLLNTADVVSGYSEAMVFPQYLRWWQTPAIVVGLGTIAALATAAVWRRDNLRRLALAVTIGSVAFLMLKHAVVRESPGSVAVLMGALFAIGLALVPHVRMPVAVGAVVVLLGLNYVAREEILEPTLDYRQKAENFRVQLEVMAIPGRAEEAREQGRESMQATYGLDPTELELLRSGDVHVAPWETGVVWAHGLDWNPLPMFQQYGAYTERLDEINADKLASPGAPDLILWQNTTTFDPNAINFPGAIDARWPAFESSAQMVEMFCRYRVVRWDEEWAVLRREADRCGPERPLKTVVTANSERVPLPATRPDEALLVRVEGLGVGGVERLRSLLYRAQNRHVLFDDTLWNMVGDTAGGGLLLRVPRWADFPGKFALDGRSETVGFERVGGFLTGADDSTELTLAFSALPLDRPAVSAQVRPAARKARTQR